VIEIKNNQTVAATVNDEPIYLHDIEFYKFNITLIQILQDKTADLGTKNQLQEFLDTTPKTDKMFLADLIKKEVMQQEVKKKGLDNDEYLYNSALDQAKHSFEGIRSEAQKENANETDIFLYQRNLDHMEAMDLTEDEYIEACAKDYYNALLEAKLRIDFRDTIFYSKDEDEFLKAYQSYIDELVKNADVKIILEELR
jgi:hypothetical protein